MSDLLQSKYLGAMIGAAIGDAVGDLACRNPGREAVLAQVELAEQLRYTDDTVMSIAVAETLIEFGDVEPQILGNLFQERYHREPWRGYSESIQNIYALVKNEGIGYIDAASRLYGGDGSFGNGAAMRVAPVAMYFRNSDRLDDRIAAASSITHAHPVAIDGARVQAAAVLAAVAINPQRPFSPHAFLDTLGPVAHSEEFRARLALFRPLLDRGARPAEAADTLGHSTAVHESVPFALYSFLVHPHEFIECLLCAVLHGGDRRTLGTMAGAISGAFLGVDALPAHWRRKLENEQHIETLAREIAVRSQ
jgi:poly(ADP-ribose) glycohydrolase ARH3